MKRLPSKPVTADGLRELVSPVRDTRGRIWPAGTCYRNLSAGASGLLYCWKISIDGVRVNILDAEQDPVTP